jgi:AAA domain/Bifunctional DNA primase/polymerase, N-terminal
VTRPSRPYGIAAQAYHKLGFAPLPLNPKTKQPLANSFHGRSQKWPTDLEVQEMRKRHGDANIAIVLPEDVIGLDIDAYDGKGGSETFVSLEDKLGVLPKTVKSTARDDGISGIRLFRVPEAYKDAEWPSHAGPGIDVISWYQRYVACWPSWHTGVNAMYRWYYEGDECWEQIEIVGYQMIPELPLKWCEFLARESSTRTALWSGDIPKWLNDHGKGKKCEHTAKTLAAWKGKISEAGESGGLHDEIRDCVLALVGDIADGHTGGNSALKEVRALFYDYLKSRDRDRYRTRQDEWRGFVGGAVKLRAAKTSDEDPCNEVAGEFRPIRTFPDTIVADDVEEIPVEWLAKPFFPFGCLVIIDGDPGQGKSLVMASIVARASAGESVVPGLEEYYGEPINCGMIGSEDDISQAVVGRLRAAGYPNNRRVMFMGLKRSKTGKIEILTFPDGTQRVESFIRANSLQLLIVDPISSFLGENVKTHTDASVRAALAPLVEVAKATGCCIILIRHLNKDGSMKAMYRGGGSIAFSAIARSGLITGVMPPDFEGQYGLAQVKCNYAERYSKILPYSVIGWEEDETIPVIEWHDANDGIDVETLVRGPSKKTGPDSWAQAELAEVMREMFDERDTWKSTDAMAALKASGVSTNPTTLLKVKKDMGISARRVFHNGSKPDYWVWTTNVAKLRIHPVQ